MKTRFFYLACVLMIQFTAKAQMKIGDNSTTINNASLLELETTNKGFVLPRVSITNASAASPLPSSLLTGTVVYNTNAAITGGSGVGIYLWDGTKWLSLSTGSNLGSSAWLLTGNSSLNASNNFIGTTDAVDFVTRTANTERMRILGAASGSSKAGWIGMGISLPRSSLDITGDYTNKNVLTLQNTSSTGFTSIDMLDNTGTLRGTFGYANVGVGGNFGGKTYFNSYGSDLLFTANSGSSHLFLQGGTGYIGINTNAPSQRLHVVGNIYLNGAFMPGGDAGTSGYVLTSAGANTSPLWKNISGLSWGLTGNSGLNATTNFIGTTDNVSMRFRTNNVQRMIIDSIGRVGIGTNTPSEKLDVLGNLRFSGALMPNNTAGNAGYFLVSSGANNPPTWFDASNYAWQLDGNPVTSVRKFGTTTNFDIPFVTNNAERMRLTTSGFLGIGTTNPAYKLSVLGTDPLYLSGVQATSTFSTDSVLTINGGVVKKTPYSSLSGNFWNTVGNSGIDSATNFLGTTDNKSLRFRTNNIERMNIDSIGIVSIGSSGLPSFNPSNPPILSVDYGITPSNTIAYFRGDVNDYFQINLRNKNNGLYASSDYVATADNGTDSTYYIDMGINNSGYGTGADYFGGPNDAYLYAYSKNLLIGTQKASTDIIFLLNGGSVKNNTAMRISSPGGNIIIGKGEQTNAPVGNVIRGPNASTSSTNIAGGSLTLQGGSSTGTATGGNLNLYGGTTVSGAAGAVYINTSTNSATNINTGTSTSTVTIGNTLNNVNLPKLSATSVVLTDAGKNLTSTTPSSNTYLYYDGTNFSWSAAATLGSFSAIAPLTYNNTTGVFAINKATGLADGYLSATDWNTFNNKVGSITLNTPPSIFSTPINFSVASGAATGTLSLNTQIANTVFAGPVSGTAAAPTFRTLVAADIPSLAGSYIQNQTTQQASSNFNISGNGIIGTNLSVTGISTLTGAVITKAGITNTGTFTSTAGDISLNTNSNNTTNINSGTSTSNVTIGNSGNNILLPKFNTAGGMIYTSAATGQIASTGANMKWDDANNRLGIGTATPSEKVDINGNLRFSGALMPNNTAGTTGQFLISTGPNSAPTWFDASNYAWQLDGNPVTSVRKFGTTTNYDIPFITNNAERMRLTAAGSLGIGVTNPQQALSVGNAITVDQNDANSGTTANALIFGSTSGEAIGSKRTSGGNNHGLDFYTSFNNRMVITNSGLVGIGTISPSNILSVSGTNPMYLAGVQATTSFTTDSILTIYNGVVKKAPSGATLSSFSVTAPLTYDNSTGVFGINQSSATADGYLSSSDWNTFNNKVGSITLNTPSSVFTTPVGFSVASGTATGTLSLKTQTANTVFAGPSSGSAAAPTFRALVAADIPSLAGSYIQNQTTQQASSNFNISGSGTIGTNLSVTGTSTLTGLVTSKAGHTNTGAFTTSGGVANINVGAGGGVVSTATNINTGTSNANVTVGGAANNILFPKFSTVGGIYYNSLSTGQLSNTGSNMTWDSVNNRLGIGTTTPSEKLDISGNFRFSGALMPNNSAGTAGQFLVSTGANSAPAWFDGSNYAWQLDGNPVTTTRTFGTTTNFDIPFITNNTERMRLTAGGSLGIGTTNPQQNLSVGNGVNIDQNNGNTGTVTNSLTFGSSSGEAIGSKRNAGGNQYDLSFYTASNNRMEITNSGNVGINTTSPQNKLDVNGGEAIGSYAGTNAAPTNGLIVSGNVGVGTTSPNNKLEITQGTAGNSGLRFTNLTSSSTGTSPTSNSDQTLTVNASGDVILNNGLSYVNKQTGAYTIAAADNRVIVYITSASAVTITIPSTLPQGFSCAIIQGGAGQLTFSGTGLQNSYSQFKTPNQYASVTIQTPALGTNVLSGQTSW